MVYTKLSVRFRLYTAKSHGRLSKNCQTNSLSRMDKHLELVGFWNVTGMNVEFVSVSNFSYWCGNKNIMIKVIKHFYLYYKTIFFSILRSFIMRLVKKLLLLLQDVNVCRTKCFKLVSLALRVTPYISSFFGIATSSIYFINIHFFTRFCYKKVNYCLITCTE